MSITSDFLVWHVGRARSLQRAGEFLDKSKNSIALSGKDVRAIASCTDKNKQHEILLVDSEDICTTTCSGSKILPQGFL